MDAIARLSQALRCLPGVGPKSAQRMVYHLLRGKRDKGTHLAQCLQEAMQKVVSCERCHAFTETPLCAICSNNARDPSLLCIVDSPIDILAIESSQAFKGSYFVLHGKISPLDGLGPEEIGLTKLQARVQAEPIDEIIVALSPSAETHATMHFIHQFLAPFSVKISQLAQGIPSGGELEYMDGSTIISALNNRALVDA